jgi:hypothetical protein
VLLLLHGFCADHRRGFPAQRSSILGPALLDEQTQAAVLKALVDAAVTGTSSESGPLGFAMGLAGIVGAVTNASAQDEQLAHQQHEAEIERDIALNDVQIANAEIAIAGRRIDFYEQQLTFLTNKRLNINFLSTLVELNERRAERQLEAGIFLAYLLNVRLPSSWANPISAISSSTISTGQGALPMPPRSWKKTLI